MLKIMHDRQKPWWKVCQLRQRSLAWHTAISEYFGAGESQSLVQEKQTFHHGTETIMLLMVILQT